jgi:large subunit ribosomal protein L3
MKKGIIGRKLGMSQIFSEDGRRIPVTVIEAGPCVVVQKKTIATDAYNAFQLGFMKTESVKENQALVGHFKSAGKGCFRFLREFRVEEGVQYNVGDVIKADIFSAGEFVDVSGVSIGKGYQGVIKRWNFQGGRSTHGSRFHRAPGSIGCSATPSRVLKNKRMPGQLGNSVVTMQRLKIVRVDETANLILIKGSVPGPSNGLVLLKNSVKA